MEYHGKLYGKIGKKHFDTGKTSQDFDKLTQEHSEMLEMLKGVYQMGSGAILHEQHLEAIQKLIKEATTL